MSFLFEAGWTLKEHRKGRFIMRLPEKIGVGNPDFCIYVVDSDDFEGYERTIEPIIKRTIPNIHGFDGEDFSFAMRNNGTIWTIAVNSEAFDKKAIDLEHFMRMSIHIKAILKAVAEEVVLGKGGGKEVVEAYLQGCNLVKMDVEKLVLKMELPAELSFGFEQELLDGKELVELDSGGEEEFLDEKEFAELGSGGEQELLDGKELNELDDGSEAEEELAGEKEDIKVEEMGCVKEEAVEYGGEKVKEVGKGWKSDVINQKLQEVLKGYSAFFKGEQKIVQKSKAEDIAALKSYLAVHQFVEEMALKKVDFSFFNKDYQKEISLKLKEEEKEIEEGDLENKEETVNS